MNVFETLREQVDIGRLIELGNGGKAHCVAPEHQDHNPSMHIYDDHVHCFACGFHGDVTDVWAAMRGFDRPLEAALDLAGEFAIELPEETPEARQKARERRDKEDLYLQQAKACHGALARHLPVTAWWEARGFGQELRERFLLGTNKDGTAAVIPFWHRGRVQGLIRRNWRRAQVPIPEGRTVPERTQATVHPRVVPPGTFLVEGIVDALAGVALGRSTMAVAGRRSVRTRSRDLERSPAPLYVLPDADEEGAEAARSGRAALPQGPRVSCGLRGRASRTRRTSSLARARGAAEVIECLKDTA